LKSFIVHGHFYQPPREDPISGIILDEKGPSPYRNWNEKIYAECYKPNSELGNFSRMSFNIGPTLVHWMEKAHKATLHSIIQQDKQNVVEFGVGNAIAQAYHHTILPLQSRRDKLTQIHWGIVDFETHFGRKPKGLWMPETAMDMETLGVMADAGIEFTILAPWQAKYDDIDVSQPYLVNLGNNKSIAVFFYHAGLSSLVSFNSYATQNADRFVEFELLPTFQSNSKSQYIMIASDGELYGHHQQLRSFFLERLLDGAVKSFNLKPIFPSLWLKENDIFETVELKEFTSWSCHHGLGRWLGECSCTPGERSWKLPLLKIFHSLADKIDQQYFDFTHLYIDDPWLLRNHYIYVKLGQITFEKLLLDFTGKVISSSIAERIHLLLQAQFERQRMFTSCGWFFDDFDRIEPRNNVSYAAQAIHLINLATGDDFSPDFARELAYVRSSRTGVSADTIFLSHLDRTKIMLG
jgi:alpha-amylase/alpha-mannosidase (GH57 family)